MSSVRAHVGRGAFAATMWRCRRCGADGRFRTCSEPWPTRIDLDARGRRATSSGPATSGTASAVVPSAVVHDFVLSRWARRNVVRMPYDRAYWEELWEKTLREHPDKVAQRSPNAHVIAVASSLSPGRALDAGCGHGAETLPRRGSRRRRRVRCKSPSRARPPRSIETSGSSSWRRSVRARSRGRASTPSSSRGVSRERVTAQASTRVKPCLSTRSAS